MTDQGLVTIAGAAGAWGDSSLSTPQLLADGRADYVVYEGLAEITMAILSRARAKDREQGYARDLIENIARNVDAFRQRGMTVITNAGGVNPEAAAKLIRSADPSVQVAVVSGDDLAGTDLMPEGALSANVYLGARPIAAALEAGAEVVVTGRMVDSALALGPLIHEFGWDEYDLLSAGSLAGHLIECGPQATGGLATDWEDTSSWANPGYPLVEVAADGSMVITTPADSDGIVNERTVTEQILYEIGDPTRYLLPDVTCDWSEVGVEDLGDNRVRVGGARGFAPPMSYKACAQTPDGWRAMSLLYVGGIDAEAKARRAGNDIIERGIRMLESAGLGGFRDTSVEVIGSGDEVMLKVSVHHDNRDAVGAFVREIPSLGLGGPPGVTGGGAGLPRPTPLIRLDCFEVERSSVEPVVYLNDADLGYEERPPQPSDDPTAREETPIDPYDGPVKTVPLVEVAHGRSGDKGSHVNVGIRARTPEAYPVLLRELTADVVADRLRDLGASSVERFELPGIHAVNFMLYDGLGAGGTASLRMDPQGKAVAQRLLATEVAVPEALV